MHTYVAVGCGSLRTYVRLPMSKRTRKADTYAQVTGGKMLVFHGGWSPLPVPLPCVPVSGDLYVQADMGGNFVSLVFGNRRPAKEKKANVTCVAQLSRAVQAAALEDEAGAPPGDAPEDKGGAPAPSAEKQDEPMADDPLADAMAGRQAEARDRKKARVFPCGARPLRSHFLFLRGWAECIDQLPGTSFEVPGFPALGWGGAGREWWGFAIHGRV